MAPCVLHSNAFEFICIFYEQILEKKILFKHNIRVRNNIIFIAWSVLIQPMSLIAKAVVVLNKRMKDLK